MKAAALAASSIWLLAISAASAQVSLGAAAIDSCTDYVSRTMSQVQMGVGCNLPKPQWSDDATEHMTWCKDASPRSRGREYEARRTALVLCRGDTGLVPISNCNDYASRARSQVELSQAVEASCRFEGMRWSSNLVQHMNWCNRTPRERHEFEDAERRRELAACDKGKE